jgi:thiol-disulfide isomerase/thioredoxin
MMSQSRNDQKTSPPLRSDLRRAALAACLGFAAVALYVSLGQTDNAALVEPAARAAATTTEAATENAPAGDTEDLTGRLAAFVMKKPPQALPEVKFQDATGAAKTLADFRGKTILLNLWATWCAPCRKEMPSLDRLQRELGSDRFEVVTLALERNGAAAAEKFFKTNKIESLKLYVDPSTRAGSQLRALGLPVTILVDPSGNEIGRIAGPADWGSAEAKALVMAGVR